MINIKIHGKFVVCILLARIDLIQCLLKELEPVIKDVIGPVRYVPYLYLEGQKKFVKHNHQSTIINQPIYRYIFIALVVILSLLTCSLIYK